MLPILLAAAAVLETQAPVGQLQLEIRFLVWKNPPQTQPRIPDREPIMAGADDLIPRPILSVGKLPTDAETVASLITDVELEKPFHTTARIGDRLVEVSGTLTRTAKGTYHLEFEPTQVRFTPYGPMTQRSHTVIEFGLNQWYVLGTTSHTITSTNSGQIEEKRQTTGFAARIIEQSQTKETGPTTDSTPYADPDFEE
jgi:hypothetical protein